jgi:chromosome partitioning protein
MQPDPPRYFKIIATGTLKGGVGKSNVLFNMAGILAEEILYEMLNNKGIPAEKQIALLHAAMMGDSAEINQHLQECDPDHRILLIDADPQFNLTNNIGIDVRTPGIKTTQQIFETSMTADELIYRAPIAGLPNLDIIPASLFLTETEINLVSKMGRELIFTDFLRQNLAFLNQNYRYVLVDTNPNLYMINQNVFLAADNVIIVSDCSFNSISGAEFFMDLWNRLKAPMRKADNFRSIIVNKYDTRPNKRSREFMEFCQNPDNENIARLLIKQYIPLNERIADTETAHIPINILPVETSSERASKSKAIDAYKIVIAELKERGIL